MSADPRWTRQTRELVARAICDSPDFVDECWSEHVDQVDAALTALADAGLLRRPEACPYDHSLDPGPDKMRLTVPLTTETRVEWGVQVEGQPAPWGGSRYRDRAQSKVTSYRETWPDIPVHLVQRTVHTEPWQASR